METRTIILPPQIFFHFGAKSDFPWQVIDRAPMHLCLAAQAPIEYVDPFMLAAFGAWAYAAKHRGFQVEIDDTVKTPTTWRNGLLSALAGKFGEGRTESETRFFAHVQLQTDINAALDRLAPVLHLDEESTKAVRYCLSELLNNVFEHSGSPEGAFMQAGWFPKTQRVSLAIADLGGTIPTHIGRLMPNLDEEQRLAAALEPMVSGSFDRDRNRGLGLFMTRRVARILRGKFWLHTGAWLARDDEPIQEVGQFTTPTIEPAATRWPGTLVGLTFFPPRLPFDRELRYIQDELAGRVHDRPVPIFCDEPPENALVVWVPPDVGTMAQDKLAAKALREAQIMPHLRAGGVVALVFKGVALTTQSFGHALAAEALRFLGPQVEGRLWVVGACEAVKAAMGVVVASVLEE